MSESPIACFACDREPTQQCARCGRPYCDEHGAELCDACLEPASGVPSFTLYRGSLLALLIGTALAVWLLVQPDGGSGEGALGGPIVVTPTAVTGAVDTPAGGTTDPTPGDATEATPTPEPGAGETPAAGGGDTLTYTIEPGDTLFAICLAVGPATLSAQECVDQVMALNGLADENSIIPGDELEIPQ